MQEGLGKARILAGKGGLTCGSYYWQGGLAARRVYPRLGFWVRHSVPDTSGHRRSLPYQQAKLRIDDSGRGSMTKSPEGDRDTCNGETAFLSRSYASMRHLLSVAEDTDCCPL
jgi:hypothetical protein